MESQLSIHLNYTYKNGGAEKAKGGRSAKSLVGKLAVAKIQSQLLICRLSKIPMRFGKTFLGKPKWTLLEFWLQFGTIKDPFNFTPKIGQGLLKVQK